MSLATVCLFHAVGNMSSGLGGQSDKQVIENVFSPTGKKRTWTSTRLLYFSKPAFWVSFLVPVKLLLLVHPHAEMHMGLYSPTRLTSLGKHPKSPLVPPSQLTRFPHPGCPEGRRLRTCPPGSNPPPWSRWSSVPFDVHIPKNQPSMEAENDLPEPDKIFFLILSRSKSRCIDNSNMWKDVVYLGVNPNKESTHVKLWRCFVEALPNVSSW